MLHIVRRTLRGGLLALSVVCLLTPPALAAPFSRSGGYEKQQSRLPEPVLVELASFEGEISGEDGLAFHVELVAGQFLRVAAVQSSVDLEASILDPAGAEVLRRRTRHDAPTALSLIATRSGVYVVELRAREACEDCGRYRLRVEALRPAVAADETRVAAEEVFANGIQLRDEWREESGRKALEELGRALSLWRAVGETLEEGRTLSAMGDALVQLGDLQKALESYEQALDRFGVVEDGALQSETLADIGLVHRQLGDNEKALDDCQRGLGKSREVSHPRGEAQALFTLALVRYSQGEMQEALTHLREALEVWRRIDDRREQAETLLYVGLTSSNLSDEAAASEAYREALALWLAVGERRGEARTLRALGLLYTKLGEWQKALDTYERARRLFIPLGDKVAEAALLNGMGAIYTSLNDPEAALGYHRQALRLFQEVGLRRAEGSTLLEIGLCHYISGAYSLAFESYREALSIFRGLGNRTLEADALGNIGQVHHATGDRASALDHFERALALKRASGDRREQAYTLNDMARIYYEIADPKKALVFSREALALSRAAADPPGEAQALFELARVEALRGNLDEARNRLEGALRIDESLREKVAGWELRSSYFASVHEHWELYVDLLMRMDRRRPGAGYDALALQAAERARARSLLDSLAEARVDIRQGVDPDFLERERALKQLLNSRAELQAELRAAGNTEELTAIQSEIKELTTRYEGLQALLRSSSPRYAALTQPEPSSLDEIQTRILDDETVLLEYALGAERSYLWAVTKTTFHGYELPPRAEIEGAARTVYGLLTARQPMHDETPSDYLQRVKDAETRYWTAVAALSEVLVGPVAGELEGKRILFVGDGTLQYLPFGALVVPRASDVGEDAEAKGSAAQETDAVPMIVAHEVVSLPSVSTLAVLRRERSGRDRPTGSVAVVADPVFELDDPRIATARANQETDDDSARDTANVPSGLGRGLRDVGLVGQAGAGIPRLPSTRREADTILALTAPGSGMKAMGFAANREIATSPELGRYRIVHYATHGMLNNEHPELSGIVLSMVDERGRPRDGFLRLHDIYRLDLPVDLVVLSACSSALGKEVRGEGLVGLVRGFMYAGAARVVASLWKVDDEATGVLMEGFYRKMLVDGLGPAAALREAQISMWRQKRWRSPFYWAAFVLQGEWRELEAGT